MTVISVADEGEFAVIRRITRRLPTSPGLVLGPGDDAAVIAAPDGRVVATTDLMVEGQHFRRDWSTGYDVGRKAAAANLADVVAMGARPTALLVGLAAPADLDVEWAEALADGLRDECALLGVAVAGGDLVRSETLTVAVTALGDLAGREPVTRAGAQPGNVVVLLGRLGWAAAGLALLAAGRLEHPLADAHRRPQVPYAETLDLVAGGGVTAMIDVSDGLLADLGHLATASQVRIEVEAARLPVDPGVEAAAATLGVDSFDWVATGGDDHGFAATVAPSTAARLGRPVVATIVALASGQAPSVVVTDRPQPPVGGHDHFRPDPTSRRRGPGAPPS